MEKKKVLILGAKGMLGQELARVYGEDPGYEVFAWDKADIDITEFGMAEEKIRRCVPDIIINAIACNAVDQCETDAVEYAKAMVLNAEVPMFLARLSKEIRAIFLHYSSDYVFDGENESGYAEDAEPNPISNYGRSKRAGERHVLSENDRCYIVRLSKLFGKSAGSSDAKKSFFEQMLELAHLAEQDTTKPAGEKVEVKAVDEERSCFTYAPDLALATKVMIQHVVPYGIYHLVNEKPATWYEATKELFRIAGKDIIVIPVSADAFPRPARRPKYSILRNTKFIPFRPYTEALEEFLKTK